MMREAADAARGHALIDPSKRSGPRPPGRRSAIVCDAPRRLARLLPDLILPWRRHVRRIEPMQDGPLLHMLYAALMGASMMLTWQFSRLRKP